MGFLKRKRPAPISRARALAGCPVRSPTIAREEIGNGGLKVTVRVGRPGWQRWFGAASYAERSFEMDSLGREVYESCDGKRDVASLTRSFSQRHRIGLSEAELAVTAFLRTLMMKSLVAMAMAGGEDG